MNEGRYSNSLKPNLTFEAIYAPFWAQDCFYPFFKVKVTKKTFRVKEWQGIAFRRNTLSKHLKGQVNQIKVSVRFLLITAPPPPPLANCAPRPWDTKSHHFLKWVIWDPLRDTKNRHFLERVRWRFSIHNYLEVQKSDLQNAQNNLNNNTQSELSAGAAKRDLEKTPKFTHLNCILAPWSRPLGLVGVGRLWPSFTHS